MENFIFCAVLILTLFVFSAEEAFQIYFDKYIGSKVSVSVNLFKASHNNTRKRDGIYSKYYLGHFPKNVISFPDITN